jgi:hypothetical protein
VNPELDARLRAEGLKERDARHVANAFVNGCHFFVTLDTKDILPIRTAIEVLCAPMRIVTPTELLSLVVGYFEKGSG